VFRRGTSRAREMVGLFPGLVFTPNEYLGTPSSRDFFYAARRESRPAVQ
jgi:hypothetical protein